MVSNDFTVVFLDWKVFSSRWFLKKKSNDRLRSQTDVLRNLDQLIPSVKSVRLVFELFDRVLEFVLWLIRRFSFVVPWSTLVFQRTLCNAIVSRLVLSLRMTLGRRFEFISAFEQRTNTEISRRGRWRSIVLEIYSKNYSEDQRKKRFSRFHWNFLESTWNLN